LAFGACAAHCEIRYLAMELRAGLTGAHRRATGRAHAVPKAKKTWDPIMVPLVFKPCAGLHLEAHSGPERPAENA